MKKALPLYLFLLAQFSYAQGLVINELSNGPSGSKEYVELLAIGSDANPLGPFSFSGWIIDDNNGAFGALASGMGISSGHIRIKAGCLDAVPAGSIIVIYNSADKNAGIPADDLNDSNGDHVYVIPSNSACLEACTTLPLGNSNASYSPCTYGATVAATWTNSLVLGNNNDAMQVRRPDASFYHGLSYGSAITPSFPSFPAELGGGTAFNSQTSAAGGQSIIASCGTFNAAGTYSVIAAASETPGGTNNASNSILIQNIRNGTYDYLNPANPDNCVLALPLHLLSFDAVARNLHSNTLNWRLTKVDPSSWVNIQRSENGYDFTTIERMPLVEFIGERDYSFIDFTPFQTTYYRLEFHEPFAKISYSQVRAVSQKTNDNIRLYPNPTNGRINLALNEALANAARCEVVDALGRVLIQSELPAGHAAMQLETEVLPAGHYFLRLSNEETALVRPFIKH